MFRLRPAVDVPRSERRRLTWRPPAGYIYLYIYLYIYVCMHVSIYDTICIVVHSGSHTSTGARSHSRWLSGGTG